ncbi:hypothetical protein AC578_1752, partial [Pseudocercospora eumusae]
AASCQSDLCEAPKCQTLSCTDSQVRERVATVRKLTTASADGARERIDEHITAAYAVLFWRNEKNLDLVPRGHSIPIEGLRVKCSYRQNEDCSLNGICSPSRWTSLLRSLSLSSSCQCDPGWIGDNCGVLDLKPARRGKGYNHTQIDESLNYHGPFGNSSWGGQIIHDPDDHSLFHLFADQFDNGCGLSGWRPNSFVVRAESRNGPRGPYHFVEKVTDTFRHNSRIAWSEKDQKWLLWTIGADFVAARNSCASISSKQ